jgi:hypothetical protein
MDALAAALGSVHVTGAIFFDAVCRAPWGFAVPAMESVAHVLSPGSERLVGYHLVAEGRAVIRRRDAQDVPVAAGDIVVFPHSDPHTGLQRRTARLIDSGESVGSFLAGQLGTMRLGGEGEATRLVCGYFGCERHAARLFLAGLPPMITINVRGDAAGEWLESSIRHLLSEAASRRPGRTALLSKMAEALFIETLRRYMELLPSAPGGMLSDLQPGPPTLPAGVPARSEEVHHEAVWLWQACNLAADAVGGGYSGCGDLRQPAVWRGGVGPSGARSTSGYDARWRLDGRYDGARRIVGRRQPCRRRLGPRKGDLELQGHVEGQDRMWRTIQGGTSGLDRGAALRPHKYHRGREVAQRG